MEEVETSVPVDRNLKAIKFVSKEYKKIEEKIINRAIKNYEGSSAGNFPPFNHEQFRQAIFSDKKFRASLTPVTDSHSELQNIEIEEWVPQYIFNTQERQDLHRLLKEKLYKKIANMWLIHNDHQYTLNDIVSKHGMHKFDHEFLLDKDFDAKFIAILEGVETESSRMTKNEKIRRQLLRTLQEELEELFGIPMTLKYEPRIKQIPAFCQWNTLNINLKVCVPNMIEMYIKLEIPHRRRKKPREFDDRARKSIGSAKRQEKSKDDNHREKKQSKPDKKAESKKNKKKDSIPPKHPPNNKKKEKKPSKPQDKMKVNEINSPQS